MSHPIGTIDARRALIEAARAMNAAGLNHGSAGNLSLRLDAAHCLITPTGRDYDDLSPDDLPVLRRDGVWFGGARPSSEWRFHRDILDARAEAGAVLHAHAPYASAIACRREPIPAFHYMVAVAGGEDIRCAPYATFGTAELSRYALEALDGRRACLLANHGLIALGRDLKSALKLAIEVEALAAMYYRSLCMGGAVLLDRAEMARVIGLFRTYGTPGFPDDELRRG